MEIKRKKRNIIGTKERPRVSVFRSLNHIYAQIVDDLSGKTLVSASSLKLKKSGGNIAAAKEVGRMLAETAIKAGIKKVVFDRGHLQYHGRAKALADAAREGGLQF